LDGWLRGVLAAPATEVTAKSATARAATRIASLLIARA
jgi:hypothetical protein